MGTLLPSPFPGGGGRVEAKGSVAAGAASVPVSFTLFFLFSLQSTPNPALPRLQQCCRGKQRKELLRPSSSPSCHHGGMWPPRRKPNGSCSQMVPRSLAPITPRSCCQPPRCPMEVRGVHGGLQAVWKDDDGVEEVVKMLC